MQSRVTKLLELSVGLWSVYSHATNNHRRGSIKYKVLQKCFVASSVFKIIIKIPDAHARKWVREVIGAEAGDPVTSNTQCLHVTPRRACRKLIISPLFLVRMYPRSYTTTWHRVSVRHLHLPTTVAEGDQTLASDCPLPSWSSVTPYSCFAFSTPSTPCFKLSVALAHSVVWTFTRSFFSRQQNN